MAPLDLPESLIDLLRTDPRTTVLTGAGISQESGLRTFRDAQTGLWAQHRPEDLASPQAFARDPQRVWDWYAERRQRSRAVAPNPGHYALAEMARRISGFTLITQNVDGLHQRAGSRDVLELHGNILRVRCSGDCGSVESWTEVEGQVPVCVKCGALLRPDVVWFGESLSVDVLRSAAAAARASQLFFSVGTSGLVQPAASLAHAAKNRGATLVEVNIEPTPLTGRVDFFLQGRSGEVLQSLVTSTWSADRNGGTEAIA